MQKHFRYFICHLKVLSTVDTEKIDKKSEYKHEGAALTVSTVTMSLD